MKYQKQISSGAWAKASEIKSGSRAKIVSETISQSSSFLDKDNNPKTQDVAKVRFENLPEALNVSLNRTTINGLIDAFGEDSVNWQNHYLKVETEKVRVAGRAVTALYLIPEGYEKIDDENGYAMIVKSGYTSPKTAPESTKGLENNIPVINEDGGSIDLKDIPF